MMSRGSASKILPDLQALADVMIMLCTRLSEVKTLCRYWILGYAKNRILHEYLVS